MKTALLLSLMAVSLMTTANAKGFFGTVDKYIIARTGQVIEVGSNDIDNGVAEYFDYRESKRKTINMSELSKSTREEIAGVKAGETILLTTGVANSTDGSTISRYCTVFYVFENKMSHVGCKTYAEDNIAGQIAANRLDFIVGNVESVIAEVASLEGFKTNEAVELAVNTKYSKAGREVKILAIFANGEVLVQKTGFNVLDTGSIVTKHGAIDRVLLSDLNKL